MKETIKAVTDRDWRNCPSCKSEIVSAVENGFEVEGKSTDLMLCYACLKLFVVYPDWYFKGRAKAKKLAEFPKEITVEISEKNAAEKENLLKQYLVNRAIYEEAINNYQEEVFR